MSDFTRALLSLVLLVLLVLGGRWVFLQAFEQRTRSVHNGLTGEARENLYLAAQHLLVRGGVAAESIAALEQILNQPAADDALLITTSRRTLRREFSEQLLAWVAAGGHLIVTAREPPSSDEEQDFDGDQRDWLLAPWQVTLQTFDFCAGDEDCELDEEFYEPVITGVEPLDEALQELELLDDEDPEGLETIVMPGVDSGFELNVDHPYYLSATVEPEVTVMGLAGEQLMQFPHGRGRVTVLTFDWLWTNHQIGNFDHARYLWHVVTLGGVPSKVWLVYREDMPPLWRWLWERGWAMISVLAVMLLLGLWRAWPRFGPLLPAVSQPRRSLREHIQAAGRWRWRHGQSAALLGGLREALAHRIYQIHPGWQQLPSAEFDRRLANLSGLSSEEVALALRSEDGLGEAWRFTRVVQLLRTIRRKL